MLNYLPVQARIGLGLVMLTLAAACGSDNSAAPTPVVAVTAVSASVTPATGASFTFSGTITSTGAGPVTYRWERGDGFVDVEQTLQFGGAGSLSVNSTWSPGLCVGASRSLWVRLAVLSPNAISSANAAFTRSCLTLVPVLPPLEPLPHP